MRLIMTMMVRDEIDIIDAVISFHLSAGIDHILVTDNGSIDGTREVLSRYEEHGNVTVFDDPVHNKQQSTTVTAMARRAASQYEADWILNSDADEFWFPRNQFSSLKSALESISPEIGSMLVPVFNLTGIPARQGTGFERLVWRDLRTETELHSAGLFSQPTHNCVHRADPEVNVVQGNHNAYVSVGHNSNEYAPIEVLHLPWRSYRQISTKVRISGEAYDANPGLTPSPRHHGMADYRRLKAGRFEPMYIARHPAIDADGNVAGGASFEPEFRLRDWIAREATIEIVQDELYSADSLTALRRLGDQFGTLEELGVFRVAELESELRESGAKLRNLEAERRNLRRKLDDMDAKLKKAKNRRIVRLIDRMARVFRRSSGHK